MRILGSEWIEANAPPPCCLSLGVGTADPFSFFPEGNGAPGSAVGGLRGPPWSYLRTASPAPGRSRTPDRTELRIPSADAPLAIPVRVRTGPQAEEGRLPALHRGGHCRTAAPARASRRV